VGGGYLKQTLKSNQNFRLGEQNPLGTGGGEKNLGEPLDSVYFQYIRNLFQLRWAQKSIEILGGLWAEPNHNKDK
jgi:hypothetical protein